MQGRAYPTVLPDSEISKLAYDANVMLNIRTEEIEWLAPIKAFHEADIITLDDLDYADESNLMMMDIPGNLVDMMKELVKEKWPKFDDKDRFTFYSRDLLP